MTLVGDPVRRGRWAVARASEFAMHLQPVPLSDAGAVDAFEALERDDTLPPVLGRLLAPGSTPRLTITDEAIALPALPSIILGAENLLLVGPLAVAPAAHPAVRGMLLQPYRVTFSGAVPEKMHVVPRGGLVAVVTEFTCGSAQ